MGLPIQQGALLVVDIILRSVPVGTTFQGKDMFGVDRYHLVVIVWRLAVRAVQRLSSWVMRWQPQPPILRQCCCSWGDGQVVVLFDFAFRDSIFFSSFFEKIKQQAFYERVF